MATSTMSRLRAAGGMSILLTTALLIGACARSGDIDTASPAQLTSTQTRLDKLIAAIDGELDDLRAGQLLTYVAYQRPIRDCMRAAGLSYTPPPFANPYATWPAIRPLTDPQVIAPTTADHVIERGLYVAEDLAPVETTPNLNPGFTSLDDQAKIVYSTQVDRCQPAAAQYQNLAKPALSTKLFDDLMVMIEAVAGDATVQKLNAGYATCMARQGLNTASRSEIAHQVRNGFAPLVDAESGRVGPGAQAAVTAAKAQERLAAQADADCRRDANTRALTLLEPRLTKFEIDHDTELQQLDADWAALRARAADQEKAIDW